MTKRALFLREHYQHLNGEPLVSTPQALALTGLKRDTYLRHMRALGVVPARRGKHGRLWWRRADITRLIDNDNERCDSDGVDKCAQNRLLYPN